MPRLVQIDKPYWFMRAETYIGQKEIAGTRHNPVILRMWQRIRAPFTDDETPWCAGFVGSVLEECNILSTRSAAALSYRTWGIGCPWPTVGAIAYMSRRNSAGKLVGGHVAFVAGKDFAGNIILLGGNQGNMVRLSPFAASRIQGYRWPKGYALPNKASLPIINVNAPLSTNEA